MDERLIRNAIGQVLDAYEDIVALVNESADDGHALLDKLARNEPFPEELRRLALQWGRMRADAPMRQQQIAELRRAFSLPAKTRH